MFGLSIENRRTVSRLRSTNLSQGELGRASLTPPFIGNAQRLLLDELAAAPAG
jgi:hypothetical protein